MRFQIIHYLSRIRKNREHDLNVVIHPVLLKQSIFSTEANFVLNLKMHKPIRIMTGVDLLLKNTFRTNFYQCRNQNKTLLLITTCFVMLGNG